MQYGLVKQGLAEMIGTFLFVLVGAGSICALRYGEVAAGSTEASPLVVIALAHGLALMVAVYATAHISGGSINPAVNLGLLILGRLSVAAAVVYTLFQCVGAIVAGFALSALFGGWAAREEPTYLGAPHFDKISPIKAGLAEALFTFVLVYVVLACAVDPNRRGKQMFGLCIGLTLTMCVLVAGPMTGASLNPARYLGPAIAVGYLGQAGVYLVAPLVGGALAAIVYRFLFIAPSTAPEDEV